MMNNRRFFAIVPPFRPRRNLIVTVVGVLHQQQIKQQTKVLASILITTLLLSSISAQEQTRSKVNFDKGWTFYLGDDKSASYPSFDDGNWRKLNLPHDWSIELPFDSTSPSGVGGGALRGGIGWYRKTFTLPSTEKEKHFFIDFDGVYRNSEVWINGHYLGLRPYGFISFEYDITQYLKFGTDKNVIAVRVDNSKQPNSRWYSGSGIYRNVWLVSTNDIIVNHWGTFVTTPKVSSQSATVNIKTTFNNLTDIYQTISATTVLYNNDGVEVARESVNNISVNQTQEIEQNLVVNNPILWSDVAPYLYKAKTIVTHKGKVVDEYETVFGIRYFSFDIDKGFSLNGKPVKIKGVCNHHDLGCLGAAINYRALERQLEILKAMGCNGIRTSHNPPAPELLELADKMGFIVMDEAFDMWKREKNPYDYHLDWDKWHVKDFQDQLLRDRNHPCVFMWSIGNEVNEQWNKNDTLGTQICRELVALVKQFDTTRPTVSAMSDPVPGNPLVKANAMDLIGFNYHQYLYKSFHDSFPGQKFMGTETVSALETRGHYDLFPSDSIRHWPSRWDEVLKNGNPDNTVSAYDNVCAPWGNTHEESWKQFKKYPFLSGEYIWTGFDYIGEPTPYVWPSHSSYFGIIDLAGFPKDVYYMYQSEWTNKTVLHILPHWNWKQGDTVDVWAYYNNADEVELFLNGKSLGIRKKTGDDLHVKWRVAYKPGTLKAISRKDGKTVMVKEVKTAGKPAKIILTADRNNIKADGNDLSYITATVVDAAGNTVPNADNLITFTTKGEGAVIATDNGCQTSLEPFKSNKHKAFNGLCLALLQSKEEAGVVTVTATAEGLQAASVVVTTK